MRRRRSCHRGPHRACHRGVTSLIRSEKCAGLRRGDRVRSVRLLKVVILNGARNDVWNRVVPTRDQSPLFRRETARTRLRLARCLSPERALKGRGAIAFQFTWREMAFLLGLQQSRPQEVPDFRLGSEARRGPGALRRQL